MNQAIQIDHVCKRFRDVTALDHVAFSIANNEIFGLLGPNGAGKTTLMRILVGILTPDEGKIIFHSSDPRSWKQRIGYLPEERGLYQKMKVRHLLHYFAAIKGVDQKTRDAAIPQGLERVGLAGQENKKIQELSKGNQQRIQLLIALLHQPSILILDEPFTGLDPIGVDQMKTILMEEAARGAAVIISTHRMEDAEQLCRNIALIHRGRLIRSGSLEQIKASEGKDELIVKYQGDANAISTLPEISIVSDENQCLRLRLNNGIPIPEIVRKISSQLAVVEVIHAIPTLHDIFVRLVGAEVES
ncbi:MAG: ATP-binding cassette domain-containing protein [Candidatus Omnitrophota bacterium]|jgi:ABC-2 type transport system ATP-binding protein|nr:MAG: ATP-binding cassette domain-containing protein [Candidatus Omnitrophota bacterium]